MKRIPDYDQESIRHLKTQYPAYGHKRITKLANTNGIKVSRSAVYNILSEAGLLKKVTPTIGTPPVTIIKEKYGLGCHYSEKMKAGWRRIKFYGVGKGAISDGQLLDYIKEYYKNNNPNKIVQVVTITAKHHTGFMVDSIVVNII